MSEAKDWAGELISGQTGTGRILVSGHTLREDSLTSLVQDVMQPRPQTGLTQKSRFKLVVSYKSCMKPSTLKL